MERNRSTRRHARLITALAACTVVAGGCALSDYHGYLNHATSDAPAAGNGYRIQQFGASNTQGGLVGESKYWGGEGSFIVDDGTGNIDQTQSGTYASTMEYDWRGTRTPVDPISGTFPSPILITTYRNPVVSAFSGDGQVDRDGDDMRLNAGDIGQTHNPADPAGIFERRFLYVDRAGGCQFWTNFEESFDDDKKTGDNYDDGNTGNDQVPEPGVLVCSTAPTEEVDNRDLSLECTPPAYSPDPNPATPACKEYERLSQDSFSSLDDLFKKIWSGAISALSAGGSGFTIEATSITINGRSIALSSAAVIDMQSNGTRPMNFVIDLTSAGGQELIKAILTNTEHNQAVKLGFGFLGGMAFDLPGGSKLGFNHDVLRRMLN